VVSPADPALARLLANVGPHPRGAGRVELTALRELFGSAAMLFDPDTAREQCHATLSAIRVAVGEPLRVAAELEGDIDVARLRCVLGAGAIELLRHYGVTLTDRAHGVRFMYEAIGGDDRPGLEARCANANCVAVDLGPPQRLARFVLSWDATTTAFRVEGGNFAAAASIAATDPALARMRVWLDGKALRGELPTSAASEVLRYIRNELIEGFKIRGTSMLPTLVDGDIVYAVKGRLLGELAPGDLVVHRTDTGRLVRRLIATGGHTVNEVAGGFAIDGALLVTQVVDPQNPRGALIREQLGAGSHLAMRGPSEPVGWWEVDSDELFVANDNRNESGDSRDEGPIDVGDVIGRVFAIPFAFRDGVPDWARMGLLPE